MERIPTEEKLFPDPTPKMNNIIQWNCRGLKINFIEITLLVQAFLPVAFCLQETHLKKSDTINLKKYFVYSTYVDEDERAATILVRDHILHSYVNLNTDLQTVAVRITLDKTITLCSVYIPPNSALSLTQLKKLINYLPRLLSWATLMDITPCGVAKQQPTKAKNLKIFSPRRDYVSLTTVLIHIYILGMGLIQLLILLLLIHLFF